MAGAAAAVATTSSPFPPPPPPSGNPRVSTSSLPSSFPPRARRANYLRKKILKTLENKPYPDPSNPQFPLKISTEETLQQQPAAESDQSSLSEGFVDSILGTFSTTSFTKIGLYLVGAFIFQTICAVLIFGSKDLGDKDDKDDSFSLNSDNLKKSKSRSNLFSSENRSSVKGGIGSVDGSETDNRISEIQEMARRAREQEKMNATRKGLGDEEDDGVDFDSIDRTVKKKEIDDRLTKLRRSLEGDYQKPPVKFPTKEGVGVGNSVDEDSLMFRKKYKYKSPSVDSGEKPKGFGGIKDIDIGNGTVMNGVTVDDDTLQTDEKIDGGMLSKDGAKEQERRATTAESKAGTSKEPKYDKQTSKAEKSGKSSKMETNKPRGFGKESSGATVITTKQDDFNKNDSLKAKKGGNKKSFRNVDKSSTQTDFWWTHLPYVMAVHMQKGGNGEESSGLFILRNFGLHHTVAFEDRSDATNFCYLLESFFEDLPDFSTSIIPIPTNELEDLIKSQKMKVVVVKKGQLKLYVGQPLEDVELALRALVEQ